MQVPHRPTIAPWCEKYQGRALAMAAGGASRAAIARDLGYRPTTSIDEGIPRFVDWYKSYHGL